MMIQGKLNSMKMGIVVVVCALLAVMAGSAPAMAAAPRWKVGLSAAPRNLQPGGAGEVVVLATNLGNAPVQVLAPGTPVTVNIHLPAGLTATELSRGTPRVGYLNRESEE